jgi:hypothetical protein
MCDTVKKIVPSAPLLKVSGKSCLQAGHGWWRPVRYGIDMASLKPEMADDGIVAGY